MLLKHVFIYNTIWYHIFIGWKFFFLFFPYNDDDDRKHELSGQTIFFFFFFFHTKKGRLWKWNTHIKKMILWRAIEVEVATERNERTNKENNENVTIYIYQIHLSPITHLNDWQTTNTKKKYIYCLNRFF